MVKKFKVYKKQKKQEKVYFKLFYDSDNIELIAVNKYRDKIDFGIILGVSDKGITLFKNVNEETGIALDENGYVKIIKEK